jgi:hypothetical protein
MGFAYSASGTPARLQAAEVATPVAMAAVSAAATRKIVRMVDKGTQMEQGDGKDLQWEEALALASSASVEESATLDACVADLGVCLTLGEDEEDEDPGLLKRRQRVRRLHHWHALSGSAGLLEKNPGAYAYLLRQVAVNPIEAKAIVRDARCTYAVKHPIRITPVKLAGKTVALLGADGTPIKKWRHVDGGGEEKDSTPPQELLGPFASSLCNILSCFCAMFSVGMWGQADAEAEVGGDGDADDPKLQSRYVSGLNYVAGYCLVTCRDEEAAYWLFVAIFKRVRGLFEPGMAGSNLIMEVLGRAIDENLPKLSGLLSDAHVDASFWMLGQLQTLFARSTYPRNHTKACWDAFLVSNCALDVLVRIAIAVVECLGPLLRAAKGQAAMIELLQKPPVDLLDGETLLEKALTYKLSEKDAAVLFQLGD